MSAEKSEGYRKALEKRLTRPAKEELKKIWPEIVETYDPKDEATWFSYFETYVIVLEIYKNRAALFGRKKKPPSVNDLFVFENLASAHKNNLAKYAYALKLTPRSREGANKTSGKTGRSSLGLRDEIMRRRESVS